MVSTYSFTTRVLSGEDWLAAGIAPNLARFGRRGAIVVGRGRAVDARRCADLLTQLQCGGLSPELCSGIGPGDSLADLRTAGGRLSTDLDWFLAIGGGSVIDAAKILALRWQFEPLIAQSHSLADLRARMADASSRPLIAVPTCFGSGAEVSALAEVTDPRGWKEPLVDPRLAPAEAWVDPAFVRPPPPEVQASSIADLFFNLFDPLVSGIGVPSLEAGVAVELCKQLLRLVARVPDLRFTGREALELAWLSHMSVQPGLTRPRSASVLHRIEHVVSPELGCSHGVGLALLAGSFLRRAVERGPELARHLTVLTESIFGTALSPDLAVDRWLATLPLAMPTSDAKLPERSIARRVLEAYGRSGRLPGPLAFDTSDVAAILTDCGRGPDPDHHGTVQDVERCPVNATRVFGGPVAGNWRWILLTPLPFVQRDLAASHDWTSGWYSVLRVADAGLVVRTQPGAQAALDALVLLERAGASFRSIRVVGLCATLHSAWRIGAHVRPTAVWASNGYPVGHGTSPVLLSAAASPASASRPALCRSLSALATETSDSLRTWLRCGVDVLDLELFAVASYGNSRGIPVSADLVVSDHPLHGEPLWASEALPETVRRLASDLVRRQVRAVLAREGAGHD